ncbi:MAG: outer membrane lipoprotein-sorting protein [Candidatus Thiodiazotropha sp. (ex Codakia orbicularis)]|nr:outer membrane lipoprotein-sorting protein [Candidatus Thiodiazotropha sp. (ex Codakia orbicularis)]
MKRMDLFLKNSVYLFFFLGYALKSQADIGRNLVYPSHDMEIDAVEVAKQVYFANHFYAFDNFSIKRRGSTLSVLINKSVNGSPITTAVERHLNNNYEEDDVIRSRDLAIFHSGNLRGTGMLITEYKDDRKSQDNMVWLPRVRKIRRFAQPRQKDAWGGSVFTFGDVTLRKPDDETHVLLGKKKMRTCLGMMDELEGKMFRYTERIPERSCRHLGRVVYGLKSTTKSKNWWYDYRISYVDTESFADYRTLYYKNDRLIKIIDRDWGLVNAEGEGDPRALFWKYWYGIDLRTGQQSLAVIPRKVVDMNSDRKNSFWTERTLRKIKR